MSKKIIIILIIILSIAIQRSLKSQTTSSPKTTTIDSLNLDSTTADLDYNSYYRLESYLTNENVNPSELQIIDYTCAIIISPSIEQIEKEKTKMNPEDFYTIADDNLYYQQLAVKILDSLNIVTINSDKKFFLLSGNHQWTLNVRKRNLPLWNIIFFKTNKAPIIVSAIDLEVSQVKDYFDINNDFKK